MNYARITWAMLWKDTRLLVQAWIALVAIAVLLTLAIRQLAPHDSELFTMAVTLAPNLLALGCGALLIGNEEELRTLYWLRALPVPWWLIAAIKAISSAVALAVIWLTCGALALMVLRWTEGVAPNWANTLVYYMLGNSLLLLGCGLLTAWYCRSAIASLMWIVPIAAFANLLAAVFSAVMLTGEDHASFQTVMGGALVLIGAVLTAASFAGAKRRWQATGEPALSLGTGWIRNVVTPAEDAAIVIIDPTGRPPRPGHALRWQVWEQSKWMVALFVLWTLICGIALHIDSQGGQFFLVTVFLVSALLGASTVAGDNYNRRIGFLTDRGLAPKTVWWTRMQVAIHVVVLGLLWLGLNGRSEPLAAYLLCCVIVLGYCAGVYAGFWMRRAIIGYLLAPVLALGLTVSTMYLMETQFILKQSEKQVLLLISPLVLLLATRLLTRRWMEGGRDALFHTAMSGGIALYFLLLIGTFVTVAPIRVAPALTVREQQWLQAALATNPSDEGMIGYPSRPRAQYSFPFQLQFSSFRIGLDMESLVRNRQPIGSTGGVNHQVLLSYLWAMTQMNSIPSIALDAFGGEMATLPPTNIPTPPPYELQRLGLDQLTEALVTFSQSDRIESAYFAQEIQHHLASSLAAANAEEVFGRERLMAAAKAIRDSKATRDHWQRALAFGWQHRVTVPVYENDLTYPWQPLNAWMNRRLVEHYIGRSLENLAQGGSDVLNGEPQYDSAYIRSSATIDYDYQQAQALLRRLEAAVEDAP